MAASAADITPTQFFDEHGNLIINTPITVNIVGAAGVSNKMVLPGEADGTYDVPAGLGADVRFSIGDSTADVNTVRVKIGQNPGNPMPVIVPMGGPANDDCPNAQSIAIPSLTPGTTLGAATDGVTACGGGGAQFAPGVWYTFTGSGENVQLTTCPGFGGSTDYDTKISVYCQGCGPTRTCVGGNDDGPFAQCPNFESSFTFCAQAGGVYRVLIHGFSAIEVGNFSLNAIDTNLTCTPTVNCLPPPPTGRCCVTTDPPFSQGETPVTCFVGTAEACTAAGGVAGPTDSTCVVASGTADFVLDNNPNLAIPDNNPAGVNSTINVPTDFLVVDVNVDIGITHTWVSDLIVEVTSPGGTSQTIWDQRCTSADNINATADDSGTETLCTVIGAGPIDSVFYSPVVAGTGPLAVFNGESAGGNWVLNVSDHFVADIGTLNQWSLHFVTGTGSCPDAECDTNSGSGCLECEPEADGKVTICHFPPGNPSNRHTIRVSPNALPAHCMNHGDTCGPCDDGDPAAANPIENMTQPGHGPTTIGLSGRNSNDREADVRQRVRR